MGTHNILQLFVMEALECAEISSPIIEPIKTPLQTHNIFTLGFHIFFFAKFYGDVTLVFRKFWNFYGKVVDKLNHFTCKSMGIHISVSVLLAISTTIFDQLSTVQL
jgi:hypothetical protein